jgi:tRNA pseudouridine55 synthase
MARGTNKRAVHGILLLDKPAGITSNKALQIVKRLFNANKAGHTGSLDPFATGLLPICFGEATKISSWLLNADKRYIATARLGIKTDSGDLDGEVTDRAEIPALDEAGIQAVMQDLSGPMDQVPPMYSAIKQDGTPLYKLARRGIQVERPPREIVIHELICRSWRQPDLEFEVHCSKGTYVRTLAEDLALALGSIAHLRELKRTATGAFDDKNMVSIDALQALEAIWQGRKVTDFAAAQAGEVLMYSPDGVCVGIGWLGEDGQLAPKRLFPGLVTENQAG